MAIVYRARQPSVDRDVAIKVIQASIRDNPDSLQRFQQETRLIARLEHPHILPLYDFDGAHEPPYIVMRYLDGGTLKDAMRAGLLPLGEVAYLVQQVSSALDYAHRQGIVHRDIKPSNILIDREGNTFVSDLGIARISGSAGTGHAGITLSGMVIGTPEYMSPEQAMAREDIDFWADIYSLGVMLFEMLTGQLPFTADNAIGVLLKHMQNSIPSARTLQPTLPEGIDEVLARAMAKEPEDRFGSAGELARALTQVSGGTATYAPVRLQPAAVDSVTVRLEKRTTDEAPPSDDTDSKKTRNDQQRQMTVLYLNLADFEELLLETNPEEAGATLTALLDQLQRVAEQGGGWVRERTAAALQVLWG